MSSIPAVPSEKPTATRVFFGAKVFDGFELLDGCPDVVVRGDRVVAVGVGAGNAVEYQEAERVDLTGSTLLPGFFDCHVHLITSRLGDAAILRQPLSKTIYDSVENARLTLAAGITTARDAAGVDAGIKAAIAEGIFPGPRLKIAVAMMSQTGGHGDMLLPSGVRPPVLDLAYPGRPSGIADGVEEARKVARRVLQAGADQIKIASTGGVLSPADDPRWPQFREEEIRVIVEEAEAQDKYVMAHAMASVGIMNALRAGVRSIEHGVYLDDECIQYMLDHDRYLVPTLIAPLEVVRLKQAGVAVAPQTLAKAEKVADAHRAAVSRAVEAGVKIAMGTDAGVGDHGHNLDELALLADAGMSHRDVLRATTSTAAELMGVEGELGSLAEGMLADMVVVGTDDILGAGFSAVANITAVWQGGRKVI